MPEKTSTVTVAAASSLAPILPQLITVWGKQGESQRRITIRPTFGASGTLRQQIQVGAPIDVFLSAGEKEVGELIKSQSVIPETRRLFAENRLVFAQAKSARAALHRWRDLASLPPGFRIALGKPDAVPAGRYARETLQKRGLYDQLQAQNRLIFTGTVRQAADAAATGNADGALIFATDVRADIRLRTVCVAEPGKDHTPIRYVAIVTRQTRSQIDALAFLTFLQSTPAKQVLKAAGFGA